MATNKDDVLSLGVDLDVKGAMKEMNRFQKEMGKQIGAISKKMDAFAEANKKATKAGIKDTEDLTDAVEDLADAYSAEAKVIKDLEKRLSDAHGDEKKALEEELKLLREANKERTKAKGKGGGKKSGGFFGGAGIKSGADLKKTWVEGAKDATDEIRSGIKAAFSKDLKGAVEGAFKGSAKTLNTIVSGTFNTAATGMFKGGKFLSKLGSGMAERGKARGGGGGAAMQVAGGGMKAVGGLMSKIGPLIQTFAKLGPLISTLSSAVMAIVKVFIDAEAQAKQFQKEVLQSASTVEFLGANAWDTDAAFGALEQTIKEVRDSAYSLENLKWGITAEDHKAVLNVLNQEGVSLNRIGQEARMSKKSVGEFAAELTHVSVAYSRAFGVPLQEINQLQSEMMTDLGMSLDETRLAFSQMTRAAADSGIAANKFFAIIRGVSQDLSLYNNRMEDAVRMLKMLGKVMNPREAQKFMSTAMQGLKNMGRQERLRMTLLTGSGKMGKLVERDTKRKQTSIAKTIAEHTGKSVADIEATLAKGPMAVDGLIKKLPKEVQGSIREGITEIDLQKSRAKKGVFGVSGAAANLGPAAALEAMQSALASWGGGKTLREGAGTIGMEMMAENLGVSQEQLDQMIKFEGAIDSQRKLLLDQLKNGNEEQKKAARSALKRAGITAKNDEDLAKQIDQAGYDQIMDTLDEGTKKKMATDNKVVNYAKKQSDLTQSLLDKLGVLIDFIMNQVYNVLIDMYEGIVSMVPESLRKTLGIEGPEKAQRLRSASKHGVQELTKLAGQNMSDSEFRGKLAGTDLVKAFNKGLDDYVKIGKEQQELEKKKTELAKKKEDAEAYGIGEFTKEDAKELAEATKKYDRISETRGHLQDATRSVYEGFSPEQIAEAMKMAGFSEEKIAKYNSDVAGGKTAFGALYDYSDEDFANIMRKAPWIQAGTGRTTDVMGGVGASLKRAGYYDGEKAMDPKIFEDTSKAAEDTASTMKEYHKDATNDGTLYVRFSSRFLKNDYKNTVEDAVLSAMRLALFEYYMYSEIEDRSEVAKYLQNNPTMTPQDFAKSVGEAGREGMIAGDVLSANASGGLVTDVNGGMAVVRAAAGEGLASIGKGERIVPPGGGNTNVNVNVSGIGGNDLAQIIRAKVIDGIAEYKRRERFS